MNPELEEFVQCELAQLGCVAEPVYMDDPVPQRLYHLTDAAGMEGFFRHGTVRALDWRLGWGGPLVRYGVELVEEFLEQPGTGKTEALRKQFRQATRANFHPRGTHFDGFVFRLYDASEAQVHSTGPGYLLGLSTAALLAPRQPRSRRAMRLLSAIYSHERQLSILQTLYRRYEDYFVSAVKRFGEQHGDELLPICWDRFRYEIGTFLMRFRDPGLHREREWIALALSDTGAEPGHDPVVFEVVKNRLVPTVVLDLRVPVGNGRTLPLEVIAIGPSLPFESTREALSAYLRFNRIGNVAIVACGQGPRDELPHAARG
jgi:hypothetical protein